MINSKTKTAEWGRKGLIKFFDISERALNAIVESDVAKLRQNDRAVYYNIFGEIENVLSCND